MGRFHDEILVENLPILGFSVLIYQPNEEKFKCISFNVTCFKSFGPNFLLSDLFKRIIPSMRGTVNIRDWKNWFCPAFN